MRCITFRIAKLFLSCVLLGMLMSCASVNEETDHFKFAASSALRDFNVTTRPIPRQLRNLQNPFGRSPYQGCQAIAAELQYLNQAISQNEGRRVGYRRENNTLVGRFGNLRDTGVKAAATFFTPYRGVVRQVTGAAAYEKSALQADQRARTRLGYLVGQGQAMQCPGF
ncbi:MAG: hypothetical protein COA43_16385 [Robiginitomaculum sp.]|nr:MAG: hypothetical protein COA43_16385 [Robiginitomaculum sp.]